jgi:hypothetical protein
LLESRIILRFHGWELSLSLSCLSSSPLSLSLSLFIDRALCLPQAGALVGWRGIVSLVDLSGDRRSWTFRQLWWWWQ